MPVRDDFIHSTVCVTQGPSWAACGEELAHHSLLKRACWNGSVPRLTVTQRVNKQPTSSSSTGRVHWPAPPPKQHPSFIWFDFVGFFFFHCNRLSRGSLHTLIPRQRVTWHYDIYELSFSCFLQPLFVHGHIGVQKKQSSHPGRHGDRHGRKARGRRARRASHDSLCSDSKQPLSNSSKFQSSSPL